LCVGVACLQVRCKSWRMRWSIMVGKRWCECDEDDVPLLCSPQERILCTSPRPQSPGPGESMYKTSLCKSQ
jgi:hypothetical protein